MAWQHVNNYDEKYKLEKFNTFDQVYNFINLVSSINAISYKTFDVQKKNINITNYDNKPHKRN